MIKFMNLYSFYLVLLNLIFLHQSQTSLAGYFELDVAANLRSTSLSKEDSSVNQSITGSIAYYFWQNSAVEISYTRGMLIEKNAAVSPLPKFENHYNYNLLGLEMILAYGDRSASFRPYVKAGVMQIEKTKTLFADGVSSTPTKIPSQMVPSVGTGLQFMLSNTFAIKFGIDAWPSNSIDRNPIIWDFATRLGISWFIL